MNPAQSPTTDGTGGTPRLSVVVVNWNTRELLRHCLESLKGDLERGLYEIIVVDNGSSDGSAEMVGESFPGVRLLANRTNRGFTAATNQGHALAVGDYTLMLNSDTVVEDTTLGRSVDYLDAHPEVGVLGCRVTYPDGSPQNSFFRDPSLRAVLLQASFLEQLFKRSPFFNWDRYGFERFARTTEVDCVMGGFMMIRESAIPETPLLDEGYFMYAEEADLCHRLRGAGWKVVYHPEPTVVHHHQASSGRDSRTAAWAYEAKQCGTLRFLRKWRGLPVAYLANLIMLIGLLPRAVGWLVADLVGALRDGRAARHTLKARSLLGRLATTIQPHRIDRSWAPLE